MKAEKVLYRKRNLGSGAIVEMVVWKLPQPVPGSSHFYKYRLFFGRNGERIVGFDNERGKGDHCHLDGIEQPYTFVSIEQLRIDFLAEVTRRLKP
ncbi:hypothetical protein CU102_26450 [Phyllobacterium brassicacearum]|uniref:Uncharacterized protein n=1 Tax=Phyllobacterium brassicacearum TaxID=314235 RepID=A0A2P7B5I0_9HYPH|nr:DUF6516 family protein [Phyllobacterium brassicacearum]PSH61725.1 hypothetical protein CU102_26450 [Phyllobacterium brassicacearum]TDQ15319.1 hypothetical protein DEV91_13432 [Phyllobacterium brassicacearum]